MIHACPGSGRVGFRLAYEKFGITLDQTGLSGCAVTISVQSSLGSVRLRLVPAWLTLIPVSLSGARPSADGVLLRLRLSGAKLSADRARLTVGLSGRKLSIGIGGTRLRVSLAKAQLGPSSRGHAFLNRTDLCVGIPRDVLAAAGARAQVFGEWPRAPVVRGG